MTGVGINMKVTSEY